MNQDDFCVPVSSFCVSYRARAKSFVKPLHLYFTLPDRTIIRKVFIFFEGSYTGKQVTIFFATDIYNSLTYINCAVLVKLLCSAFTPGWIH